MFCRRKADVKALGDLRREYFDKWGIYNDLSVEIPHVGPIATHRHEDLIQCEEEVVDEDGDVMHIF